MVPIRNFLILLALALFPFAGNSQLWSWTEQELDNPPYNFHVIQDKETAVDKLGNVVTAIGWLRQSVYEFIELVKYSPNGQKLWSIRFNGASYIYGLETDNSGNIYFISRKYTDINGDSPPNTVSTINSITKVTKTGKVLWVKAVGNMQTLPFNELRGRNFLKKDNSNYMYFATTAFTKNFQFANSVINSQTTKDTSILLIKFDTAATVSWYNHVTTGGNIWVKGIDLNENGKLVIGGHFYGGAQCGTQTLADNDYTTMFYGLFNSSNGQCQWLRKISGFGMYGNRLFDVAITRNNVIKTVFWFAGNFPVAQMTFGDTTVKISTAPAGTMIFIGNTYENGDQKNLRRVHPNYEASWIYDMDKDKDDNLFFTAFMQTSPFHLAVIKTDSAVNFKWLRKMQPASGLQTLSSHHMGIYATDNNITVSGSITNTSGVTMILGADTLTSFQSKFCFTGQLIDNFSSISGKVYADLNSNAVNDGGDILLPYVPLKAESGVYRDYDVTDFSGNYTLFADTVSTTITAFTPSPYFNVVPVNYIVTPAQGESIINKDFAIQPRGNINDLLIDVTQITPSRPGFPVRYMLTYMNVGTTTQANKYGLKFDPRLQYISSNGSVAQISSDSIVFNFSNFKPFDIKRTIVNFILSQTAQAGTSLDARAYIYPIVTDTVPSNNIDSIKQAVTGSFDPNDKQADLKTIVIDSAVAGKEFIEYTIRFQNTGTDTAFAVRIADTLSAKVDLTTFRYISSSHNTEINITPSRVIEFTFPNILLPDSNKNEAASHGFVKFRLKPVTSVTLQDTIYNAASIYFDYNSPVKTNTEKTNFRISFVTGIYNPNVNDKALHVYPNPIAGNLNYKLDATISERKMDIRIYDINGRLFYFSTKQVNTSTQSGSIDTNLFPAGTYVIEISTSKTKYVRKFVKK
jgi:uncharacterized repeat protein (TIGR01451 family)